MEHTHEPIDSAAKSQTCECGATRTVYSFSHPKTGAKVLDPGPWKDQASRNADAVQATRRSQPVKLRGDSTEPKGMCPCGCGSPAASCDRL